MAARISSLAAFATALAFAAPAVAAEGDRVQVRGEIIDTWCYLSGVMGAPEAIVGSAHHTCALWCAAGGIPVGLLGDDGTLYMVLKLEGEANIAGGEMIMDLQSDTVTAEGVSYQRDGVNYLVVQDVVANEGLINATHDDFGTIPGFAIPDPNK